MSLRLQLIVTGILTCMIHAGATTSAGLVTARGTASNAGSPSSSDPEPLMQSEMTQGKYNFSNTSDTSKPENLDQNDSPIADSFAQDPTSLVSATVHSPATPNPNPDISVGNEQPIAVSHLESAVAATVSEMSSLSSYQQKDPQQQPTISNPGISVTNQKIQHPQFITPGTQTQEQANFDTDGKSGIKKLAATPQQSVEQQQQPDQAQQVKLTTQKELPQERQEQNQVVQGASYSQQVSLHEQEQQQEVQGIRQHQQVVWSGIMEFNPVSFN